MLILLIICPKNKPYTRDLNDTNDNEIKNSDDDNKMMMMMPT